MKKWKVDRLALNDKEKKCDKKMCISTNLCEKQVEKTLGVHDTDETKKKDRSY